MRWWVSAGANRQGVDVLHLSGPAGTWYLALGADCFFSRLFHSVRPGTLLPLRVAKPTPMDSQTRLSRQPVLTCQQFLVHHWHLTTAGFRRQPKGSPHGPYPIRIRNLLFFKSTFFFWQDLGFHSPRFIIFVVCFENVFLSTG